MKTMILIIMLPIAALMVFLGLMIKYKKTYWMISGYNTMTSEEQSHVDAERMGNAVAITLFIIAGLVAAGGLFMCFNMDIIGIISMLMILPVTLVTVAFSQKYDHNNEGQPEKKRRDIYLIIGLGVFFTIIIGVVFSSLINGSRQNSYTISNGVLDISGTYGERINISDIVNVELKDNLPGSLYKRNGFNLNTILKGHFNSDMGNIMLYVDTSKPPFIYIYEGERITILNYKSSDKTKELYNELKKQ